MFVGHYGVSFAAKRVAPGIPLWALFIAVQLLDVFWAPFIVFTGSLLITLVFGITLERLGKQPASRWWLLGLLWLGLTLTFELTLGRATGISWERIASDFDPQRGGFLGFGMLVILVGPRILAARQGLVQNPQPAA